MSTALSAMRIQFQAVDQVFDRVWNNMRHIPDDFREPFEKMAEAFWEQNRETFANEGATDGFDRWRELKPSYKAWKDRHYPNKPILVRTGVLETSLIDPTASGAIYEINPLSMTLGTEVPWAIYHQMGTRSHRTGEQILPPRRPVLLTMKTRTKWTQFVTDWLREEFAYDGRV